MTEKSGLIRLTGDANGECGGDDCPNVYLTKHRSVVVQGDTYTGFEARHGESLVEIPEETLREAFRALGW